MFALCYFSNVSALLLALPGSNLAEVRDLVRIDHYDGDTCRTTSGE